MVGSAMLRKFARVLGTLCVAVLISHQVNAAVVLYFEIENSTPAGVVSGGAYIAVSEQAYAQGLNIFATQGSPKIDWESIGILGFFAGLSDGSPYNIITADLFSLRQNQPIPSMQYEWTFSLSSAPNSLPIWSFFYTDWMVSMQFNSGLNGSDSTGAFGTDRPINNCSPYAQCFFDGAFSVSNLTYLVPEPDSFSLIGIGLLFLVGCIAGVGRRGCASAAQ
jgi:hypothetical protein